MALPTFGSTSMIFHDLDIEFPDATKVSDLRSKTGASVVISEKRFPLNTEPMIKKHVSSGCIFYRVITDSELLAITDEMLLFNLRMMQKHGASPWQSILLFDDHSGVLDYDKYTRKVDLWVDHGGSSVGTYGNPVRSYITKREKSFLESLKSTKTILVPNYAARKEIGVANDWTVTLATFPGVGYEGAQVIRKIINGKKLGDDLLTALWFLTDEKELAEADGNWKTVREAARKWIGLPEGFSLDIDVSLKEVKDECAV